MVVVDSEKNEPAKFDKKKKKMKVFAALCISFMHGRNVNYWAMDGVVRKTCIAKKLVEMHFFAIFLAMITNMFISSTDPKVSPSFFSLPPGLLFLQSKQQLK